MHNPLRSGELALLVDRGGKHYLVRLRDGGEFHTHHGVVSHNEIIGREEGVLATTALGKLMWAYRPRLQDYIVEMPRNSAIMYPKDIAFVLMWADIFPGARVLEAGAGSGGLTMALLRAIGPDGCLTTYETRQDMIDGARANVSGFLGSCPNWVTRLQDVYSGIDDGPYDRIVLDVPDPARAAIPAADALVAGGIICSFVPNVTQVSTTVDAYRASGAFVEIETYETIFRPWEFRGPTARPVQSMISHTGFLTLARRRGDRPRRGESLLSTVDELPG
ncbi:MAG: trmI [Chloroflexi bacterium]|nr:trmI [Chloroflexota bacterium]